MLQNVSLNKGFCSMNLCHFIMTYFLIFYFLDIEQNIEKEEHSNKTSADLRIRKTQVSSYLLPVIQVQGSILYEFLI